MAISVSSKRRAVPSTLPQRIAIIGDSLTNEGGSGEANYRAALGAVGWADSKIWFHAVIGKSFDANDVAGTALDNMDQARADLGAEPDLWVIPLGTNGNHDADATMIARVNAVLNDTTSPVIMVSLNAITGYDAGASTEATLTHYNSVIGPVVAAASNGRWADWRTYQKALGDTIGGNAVWDGTGLHHTTSGYTLRRNYVVSQIGPGGG